MALDTSLVQIRITLSNDDPLVALINARNALAESLNIAERAGAYIHSDPIYEAIDSQIEDALREIDPADIEILP